MVFTPGVNELYFQISVGGEHDTSDSAGFELQLDCSGTDAALYFNSDTYAFGIQEDTYSDTEKAEGSILGWGDEDCGRS